MSSIAYGILVDRDADVFGVQVDYSIDGYSDPESGEYFGDTTWTAAVGGYATVGYAGESDSPFIDLGLGSGADGELHPLAFNFSAQNWFTGVSVSFSLNLLVSGYSTLDLYAVGTAGEDIAITGSGDDTLRGYGGNDYLDAGAGDDIVDGGAGDDHLDGGTGDDTMIGGAGNDLYLVDSIHDLVVELPDGGDDTVQAAVSHTLAANVERLVLVGAGARNGTGNDSANRIDGNGYANTLRGLEGDDRLYGADGSDILIGDAGNDWLDGGAGRDRMTGGDGDDTYVVDWATDEVVEAADGGIDTVRSLRSSHTLAANVENLFVDKSGGSGTGNALDNHLFGAAGGNVLDGGLGNDTLDGGAGNDTLIGGKGADRLIGGAGADWASYAGATTAVQVNLGTGLVSGGDAQGDTYDSIENLRGGNGGDALRGNALANVLDGGLGNDRLYGMGGNDVLIGGAGADRLDGGTGTDTVSYLGSVGAVTVDLGAQTATGGDADGDTLIGFENAAGGLGDDTLLGNGGANRLFGDAGADHLDGGDGNDVIEGGAGADILIGGLGIDRLSYAHAAAGVTVDLGTGIATGSDAEGDSFSGFEGIDGSAFADRLTGDGNANRLSGGAADDILDGGDGNDTILGGLGRDAMTGGAGIDTLSYADATSTVVVTLDGFAYGTFASGDTFSGFENLTGGRANDVLYGDDQTNVIRGGDGSDFIAGGGGNDRLYGDAGDDTFYVDSASGRDRIYDFQAGGTEDRILLDLGPAIQSFAAAMATASMVNGSTVFNFGGGTTLTLVGVEKSALTAADIAFQPEEE